MNNQNTQYHTNELIAAALRRRGFQVEILPMNPRYAVFTAPNGWRWITRWGAISFPSVSVACKQISKFKNLAYDFAALQGVSIPDTLQLPHDNDKIDEFLRTHTTVVVKPAASFGSNGLTLGIANRKQFDEAVTKAQEFSEVVLAQQTITGEELRLTVIDGKVLSALHRQSAQVVGDGKRTIAELIAAENLARRSLQFLRLPYPQLDANLIDPALLTDERVLAKGEVQLLSTSAMVGRGASVYDVLSAVHPSYLQTVADLAAALNPDFLIIDMMFEDYTQPQTKQNYAFIEFNTTPALRLYYGVRDGQSYDIVEELADMIEKRSHTK